MPHPLYQKARRSWELGKRLREIRDFDNAANRLYYGLLQAIKAHLVETGDLEENEGDGVHGRVKAKLKWADAKDTFEDFKGFRVTADYYAEEVQEVDLSDELLARGEKLLHEYLKRAKQ
jgi:uncharacterized protein (UPF0332 family)